MLAGRSVLVTGGSSGIGRAIALAVASAGADVAITYRSNAAGADAVQEAIRSMGRRTASMHLDLANADSIVDLGSAAERALGRLDVWVNNAGADILTGPDASLTRIEKLDRLIAVDLRGTMLASWHAAEFFARQEEGGVIINMSWDHVLTGMAGTNPELYSAVKGGVLAFSKSLARSVAPRVRVNVIAPGFIETAFGAGASDSWRRMVVESTPLKRWGTADDVAGAAVFLSSPAAAFLTGQTIIVGGGVVM